MSNPSKAKGTQFESAVVGWLNANGWPHAERRALHGNTDKGDVTGIPGIVLELKATKAIDIAGWLTQAETERHNADADHGIVVWKRPRQPTGQAAAILTLETLGRLLAQAGYR